MFPYSETFLIYAIFYFMSLKFILVCGIEQRLCFSSQNSSYAFVDADLRFLQCLATLVIYVLRSHYFQCYKLSYLLDSTLYFLFILYFTANSAIAIVTKLYTRHSPQLNASFWHASVLCQGLKSRHKLKLEILSTCLW